MLLVMMVLKLVLILLLGDIDDGVLLYKLFGNV